MATGRTLKPRIRCAIYTRQSVKAEPGEDLTSCEAQREHCTLFIESQKYEGWERVRHRFDDEGVSGASLERPALQRLMKACVAGQVDRVVVWKLDRLTRSVQDWTKLAEFFEQTGVELTLAGQALDGAGLSVTNFVQHVLASFAEYERELIGERLRDARAARRALGLRASGRVPYGYEVNPRTRQLVPHSEESKIVLQIFERAADGEKATAIASWLNEGGHRTKGTARKPGGLWSGRTVLQLLSNPVHLGRRRVNGELIAAAHEALIDPQTANRVELAVGSRRTTRSRVRQRLLSYSDDPYMLRGVLYCGGCGRPMTTSSSKAVSLKRPNAHPRYYRCRGTATLPACKPPVQIAAAKIEKEVLDLLRDLDLIARQPEAVAALLDALRSQWKAMGRPHTTEVVRRLIWRATWKAKQARVELEFDEIATRSLLDADDSSATSTPRSTPT